MYTYKAEIVSVYDGDTFRANLYLGFGIVDQGAEGKGRSFRLMDVDTPEVRGDERERGLEVRDYVRTLMKPGTEVIITSVKDSSGKYGRYLAYVEVELADGTKVDLSKHLLEIGYAIPYK